MTEWILLFQRGVEWRGTVEERFWAIFSRYEKPKSCQLIFFWINLSLVTGTLMKETYKMKTKHWKPFSHEF